MLNLDEIVNPYHTIAIAGHVHPDGDALGSCLGLYNYIKTYFPQKSVHVFLRDIPDVFFFMNGYDDIEDPALYKGNKIEVFFSLDCADISRLGDSKDLFKEADCKVCIDHHVSNTAYGDYNYIIADASSTCELVANLFPKDKITKEIAECIYTGIVTDTGVFQYSNTEKSTMETAGFLMEKGIDYPKIINDVFYEKTYAQNQLMGQALLNAKLFDEGRIVATVLTEEDYKKFGASRKDTEGIASQLRYTKGCEVAIFLYANEIKGYKASLRGNTDYINLADIAVMYGGGGHAKAAGFNVGADAWKEIDGIIKKVQKLRDKWKKSAE